MFSQVVDFVKNFEQLKEFRDFLEIRLGVPDEQVATIEWSEIVNLLVRKQSQHKLFIQEDVQQFDILARICREDNYIIALYNRLHEFIPCSLSLPFGLRVHTFNISVVYTQVVSCSPGHARHAWFGQQCRRSVHQGLHVRELPKAI